MLILAIILSGLSLFMSALLLLRLNFPRGFYVMPVKGIASALAPIWVIFGIAGAVIGVVYQAPWVLLMGILGAGLLSWYIWRVTRDHEGLEKAFGVGWSEKILPEQSRLMINKRWNWSLNMQAFSELTWERDIPFWTIPGTDRELLCDIWHPANGHVSGLVFIFFHGGAWYMMDKDMGTRPFFRHLVAQGHMVMDVAYRLCPEVDIYGMIGDVKRAIAWMKANASRYGVNPEKIVLGGGSAGGHLALMGAYTPDCLELVPEDLQGIDLSVCGVISYYGPTDFLAEFEHTNQQRLVDQELPSVPIGSGSNLDVRPADWRLDILLGGWPQDALATYQLTSPINHVHSECPPTLLIQGDLDFITPVGATWELYNKLVASGVPAINIVFPWTEHAFDIFFPKLNPAAQSALYDVDRFLALLSNEV